MGFRVLLGSLLCGVLISEIVGAVIVMSLGVGYLGVIASKCLILDYYLESP